MGVPARLRPHTVTVVRAPLTTDRYGNEQRDWSNATRTDYRAWIEHRSGDEETEDRDTAVTQWLLILPRTADIVYTDRVEYGSRVFEVVSLPDTKHTPRGVSHIECTLRYTGS